MFTGQFFFLPFDTTVSRFMRIAFTQLQISLIGAAGVGAAEQLSAQYARGNGLMGVVITNARHKFLFDFRALALPVYNI